MLSKYLRPNLNDIVLILNHPYDHILKNKVSLTTMGVSSCHVFVCQRVVTIVELSYVTPEVLGDGKLASWVNLFVTLGP